ncbi:hypothetical protein ON010_g15541 [Phytophthora cinnamomi]|nr:hypothetical protein ON010_g15541 [Phytophthora cinnamomi]
MTATMMITTMTVVLIESAGTSLRGLLHRIALCRGLGVRGGRYPGLVLRFRGAGRGQLCGPGTCGGRACGARDIVVSARDAVRALLEHDADPEVLCRPVDRRAVRTAAAAAVLHARVAHVRAQHIACGLLVVTRVIQYAADRCCVSEEDSVSSHGQSGNEESGPSPSMDARAETETTTLNRVVPRAGPRCPRIEALLGAPPRENSATVGRTAQLSSARTTLEQQVPLARQPACRQLLTLPQRCRHDHHGVHPPPAFLEDDEPPASDPHGPEASRAEGQGGGDGGEDGCGSLGAGHVDGGGAPVVPRSARAVPVRALEARRRVCRHAHAAPGHDARAEVPAASAAPRDERCRHRARSPSSRGEGGGGARSVRGGVALAAADANAPSWCDWRNPS